MFYRNVTVRPQIFVRQYFCDFQYCISCHENIRLKNLFMMTLYKYFKPTKPSPRSQVWLSKHHLPSLSAAISLPFAVWLLIVPSTFSMLRANNFCNLSSKSLFLLKISRHCMSIPPCTKSTERYHLSSVTWHEIAPPFLKTGSRLHLFS